ncbi:MAG: transposase [Cardiobacteriaceae bacterium]|nr:transposase [Cardiobacteriaceae bacterium]
MNTKLHLEVDNHGMPLHFVLSDGSAADCHHAPALIAGMPAEYLLADKACDTNDIRALAAGAGMVAVIPPKANRREPLAFDGYLYRFRRLIENRFWDFKC